MPSRALLTAGAAVLVLTCAACGSSSSKGHPSAANPTTTSSSTGSSTTMTSVTAQPATTAPPGVGPASALGSTQSVTTASGSTLGVRVATVTATSPTQVQVAVSFTADGPPSSVEPAIDLHLIDTAGVRHGASLVASPSAGCPALPSTVRVTAQGPTAGCVVFTVPSGTKAAEVTFQADGTPTSSAVAWKAS